MNQAQKQERRQFYRMTARLTLPIVLQNFMDTAVSAADVVMLSFVSQTALSASSLASQVQFVLSMIFYGLSGGTAVLTAQYWGKGDTHTIEKVMGIAIRTTLLISLLFSLAAWFAPDWLMRIFTDESALIEAGVSYLRAVGAAYVLNGFCTIYLCSMRSVERVTMSAAVHCIAVVLNVVLNACFIFGWGVFPELGIVGVALATSITRAVEAVICLIDSALQKVAKIRLKHIFGRYPALTRDFFRYALPSMGNDMVWGIAFTMYSVILGHLSSDVVAANSLTATVRNLGTVVCFGCSSSAAIILGKAMGDNRLEDAKRYAGRLARLSVYTAIAGGLVILAIRPLLIGMTGSGYFKLSGQAKAYFSTMLYITSYYILGQSVNTMLICGIYRSGGDVKFGLYTDMCAMWLYAVPIGFISAFVLKLPAMWVYFILCLDEFVKMPVVIAHYFKFTWLKNITRENV